jgi:hypothetical protein
LRLCDGWTLLLFSIARKTSKWITSCHPWNNRLVVTWRCRSCLPNRLSSAGPLNGRISAATLFSRGFSDGRDEEGGGGRQGTTGPCAEVPDCGWLRLFLRRFLSFCHSRQGGRCFNPMACRSAGAFGDGRQRRAALDARSEAGRPGRRCGGSDRARPRSLKIRRGRSVSALFRPGIEDSRLSRCRDFPDGTAALRAP